MPPEALDAILLAGQCAPSAHDSRPWHFAVFQTRAGKAALLAALAARFEEDLRRAGVPSEEVQARVGRSQRIFRQAPVLVVLFVRKKVPDNPLAKSTQIEALMASQSVALAAGQMLLAAEALGASGCWFAAPLFCPEQVCTAAQMAPEEWAPQALLTLGYCSEAPKEKRAPQERDAVTFF